MGDIQTEKPAHSQDQIESTDPSIVPRLIGNLQLKEGMEFVLCLRLEESCALSVTIEVIHRTRQGVSNSVVAIEFIDGSLPWHMVPPGAIDVHVFASDEPSRWIVGVVETLLIGKLQLEIERHHGCEEVYVALTLNGYELSATVPVEALMPVINFYVHKA
jgi:hypothetical protein